MSARGTLVLRALVALGLLALAGWALHTRLEGPRVEVVSPARREIVQTVVASGRVMPRARVELGTVVLGTVRAVHVEEGQAVAAGTLVVELEDAEARAAVARAEAAVRAARAGAGRVRTLSARVAVSDLASAEAALTRAEADLRRRESLLPSGGATAAEVETLRAAVSQARAAVDAARARADGAAGGGSEARGAAASLAQAEAELAAAEARLGYTRILAPAAGVVLARDAEPGAVVQPGAVLVALALDGPLRITLEPDESTLSLLRVGQPALVSAEAFPEERFAATVSYLAPAVDPLRGTVEVRLEVPEPPAHLRTDMTVSVDVEVGRRADALTLPASAVEDVATRAPWALVVEGDRAARRDLRLGIVGEELVEVLEGLDEASRVIPATERDVEAGDRVRATAE